MEPDRLTKSLKAEAMRLGFDLFGVCPATRPPGIDRFRNWLSSGKAAGMIYLKQQCDQREHPQALLDGVKSILMLGMSYRSVEPIRPGLGEAAVARYAWGLDYHDVIRQRLRSLRHFFEKLAPGAAVRGVVDTAPLLEREFARLAGLGWIGRNSMLINRQLGSYFFLAAFLTDQQLVNDQPCEENFCGDCRACIDACPGGALGEDGSLDARRCLSYLTIEHRGPIPAESREAVGNRIFGCDVCQEVCPWNNRDNESSERQDNPAFYPTYDTNPLRLADLFSLDDVAFRQRFRSTPFWRARRRGVLRNAALVLGNQIASSATDSQFAQSITKILIRGLSDSEPIVRAACAWALGQCANAESTAALSQRLQQEDNEEVIAAIHNVLSSDKA